MQAISTPHGNMYKLASGATGAPKVSGDGSTVVWNQQTEDGLEIMAFRDGEVTQLTHNSLPDMHPSISRDGKTIAWTRLSSSDPNDKSAQWDIVIWKDGQETVLDNVTANEMDAAVSADGSKFAWSTDGGTNEAQWAIETMIDGQISQITELDGHMSPLFSGDGSRLFWKGDGAVGGRIFSQGPDGQVKGLTPPLLNCHSPAPAESGNQVCYTQVSLQGDDDQMRLHLDTGVVETVAGEKFQDECWAAQNADGSVVAWTNYDRRGQEVDNQINAVIDGQRVALTDDPGNHSFPSVSDDGKTLAWMWIKDNNTDDRGVYLLKRDS
jgi:Tol biopolymer transport system component